MIKDRSLKLIFSVSIMIVIILPCVIIFFIYPLFTDMSVKNTEKEAVRTGTHLSELFLKYLPELNNNVLPDDFNDEIMRAKKDFNLMKIKFFGPSGKTLFSTSTEDIGIINRKPYFHEIVSKGSTYTKAVKKGTKSLEGQTVMSDVVETYVPVIKNGVFVGAFELYYDISQRIREYNRLLIISSLVPLVLMCLFLIAIVSILVKADRSSSPESISGKFRSPLYTIAIISASIVAAELFVMYMIHLVPGLSVISKALLDAALLVVLMTPTIYFFAIQPLRKYIGEHKRIETELAEREEFLRSVVDTASDAIISVDNRGAIHSWNNSATLLFGYESTEIIGKPVTIIMPDRFRNSHIKGMKRLASTGERSVIGKTVELVGRTQEGKEIPLELSLSMWEIDHKRYFTGILRDITERKKLEESLRKERNQLKELTMELAQKNSDIEKNRINLMRALDEISRLIQNVTQHIDHDTRFLNPNLKKCYEVKNCSKKDCTCYGIEPERCWQTAGTYCGGKVQGTFAQKYGNCTSCEVFKEATSDPIYEIGEQFNNMMHVLEQKNMELETAHTGLKASQSTILQQEKMATIGQLAAGVAHEINNPTGFITSNLGTLGKYVTKLAAFVKTQSGIIESLHSSEALALLRSEEKKLKINYIINDVADLISESLDGAERIKTIVQNLKSFSRVDESAYKPADINECLESTLNIVWNELKYKASVAKDYGDLPATHCYPQQLNQVFMNLLVNAAHSIENQGEIKIRTWNGDGSVNISISDTGCGIPEEKIDKIFEPFFTTKEVGKGTGLGLSIAYEIVQKHKGEIIVTSQVGKGTTFIVKIPVVHKTTPV